MNSKFYISIIIAIIALIYYVIIRIRFSRKFSTAQKRLEEIKRTWTKIKVHVSECSIKTNNYSHEVQIESGRAAAINSAFGKDISNVKVEHDFQTVLYCTKDNPMDGKSYTYFSGIINKDKKTLEIYCSLDKTVDLYINPTNTQEYFFDISTLFE
jgi:YbbR domain-containing protein